jgi:hypothetical protein
MNNSNNKDIQRYLRPDQGGDILSEFALEVAFPLTVFVVLASLAFVVFFF